MTYAARLYEELDHKPFDRKMLDWFLEKTGAGLLCDMGCGPGQIARYLASRGGSVCGIDLSPGMVAQAAALNPHVAFRQGNMLALTHEADASFAGIAAFYAIVHLAPDQLPHAFSEFHRVLRPGGVALVTFHIGIETRHFDELWGVAVTLDFVFYETQFVKAALQNAGFVLEEVIERDPYPDVEVQTRRAYLFARKPG